MARVPETTPRRLERRVRLSTPRLRIAGCGALDVRLTTEHAIKRGGVRCPVCLQLAGRVSLTVSTLHEAADSGDALIP